jgi:hypothetical protein
MTPHVRATSATDARVPFKRRVETGYAGNAALHTVYGSAGMTADEALFDGVDCEVHALEGHAAEKALVAHDVGLGLAAAVFVIDLDGPDSRDSNAPAVRQHDALHSEFGGIEAKGLRDLVSHRGQHTASIHERANTNRAGGEEIGKGPTCVERLNALPSLPGKCWRKTG